MARRKNRWAPPPRGGKPPTEPVEIIDLYPNPLPPARPPATRATILTDLQAGFASLTDDELKVARLWLFGRSLGDVCHFLQLNEKTAKKLWRSMRRKLRDTLLTGAEQHPGTPQPIRSDPQSQTGTEPEVLPPRDVGRG